MEIRARVEKLMRPPVPTAVPIVCKGTDQIVSFENSVSTHRFFRGVQCFLFILCYALSMFQIESYAGNVALHMIILLCSLAGEVLLFLIYRIKARFAGFTNPACAGAKQVHALHTPYMSLYVLESIVWILQCPPGVRSVALLDGLDSLILLRVYVLVVYFSHYTTQGLFTRTIAILCGFRFNSNQAFRTDNMSLHWFVTPVASLLMWLALALMYSKAEVTSFLDALYFCFTSAAFVGYGDYSPRSFVGRLAAVLSWMLGVMLLAWCVRLMHDMLHITEPERNLYTLFRTNRLCGRVPGEAARTIQRAWKLYVAKKEQRHALSIQLNAWLLTGQAAHFRSLRRAFVANEVAFLRATRTFADSLSALSPSSSRRVTPSGTPTTLSPRRRPFALFQAVRPKTPKAPDGSGSSGGTPSPHTPRSPQLKGASGRSTPTFTTTVATAPPAPSAASAQAVAEVQQRLARMDRNLDALLAKAKRVMTMAPSMGLANSSEVDS
ncbi:ion transport protein [Strigomonas culicis]|uniref:Ion transport protein n=1 Tax=Strigomonas culicis TaxID=28005 RepID=S9ULS0_9TRYP|nr:ion transport protein [Strigomonas culicis]EPY34163.1 ion transport protein [Strigomonas culicis]|eukprot:EPY31802.1 ion transport protein [Strigomonas culicis]